MFERLGNLTQLKRSAEDLGQLVSAGKRGIAYHGDLLKEPIDIFLRDLKSR